MKCVVCGNTTLRNSYICSMHNDNLEEVMAKLQEKTEQQEKEIAELRSQLDDAKYLLEEKEEELKDIRGRYA